MAAQGDGDATLGDPSTRFLCGVALRTSMTRWRESSERLIVVVSRLLDVTSATYVSEPARSTRFNVATITRPPFGLSDKGVAAGVAGVDDDGVEAPSDSLLDAAAVAVVDDDGRRQVSRWMRKTA